MDYTTGALENCFFRLKLSANEDLGGKREENRDQDHQPRHANRIARVAVVRVTASY